MNTTSGKKKKWGIAGVVTIVVAAVVYGGQMVAKDGWLSLLLTADQQGRLLFQKERFTEAAETFGDPRWQATAWYRAGEFQKAAGMLAGFDTAESAFNHGNALAMQGKYEEAISRYERALAQKPEWEDARVNLAIAQQNNERLKQKGGEGTGGKLEADEIRFSKEKPADSAGGEETVEGPGKLSDTEMRSMWLRRVQTQPADFLRAKFAYQHAINEESR
jgi:Ca-activated chloride channel family protein